MLDCSPASQQQLRMSPCHAASVHQCRQFSKYIEGAYFAYGKFSYQLTHDEAMALCKAFSPQAYQTLMQVRLKLGSPKKPLCGNPSGCLQAWEEQACLGTNTPAMSWEQEKPRPQVAEVRLGRQKRFH